jgi:mitochondrial protein MBA1
MYSPIHPPSFKLHTIYRSNRSHSTYLAYKHLIYSKVPKPQRPKKPTVDYRSILPAALKLHKSLYHAISTGNRKALSTLCADNIEAQYQSRIARRLEAQERLSWELVKYVEKPRVVSMKAGATPLMLEGIPVGMQQAVVRIRSLQKLKTGTLVRSGRGGGAKGKEQDVEWEKEKTKDVTEYIVVQRRLMQGDYEPWKVWGFIVEFDANAELNAVKEKEKSALLAVDEKTKTGGVLAR